MLVKVYFFRKALYCHKRSAHDPDKKKYKCEECGKGFLNPCHLERHKISHSSVRSQKVIMISFLLWTYFMVDNFCFFFVFDISVSQAR